MSEEQGTLPGGNGQGRKGKREFYGPKTPRQDRAEQLRAAARQKHQDRAKQGQCTKCGAPAEPGKKRCETHRIKENQQTTAYRNKIGREKVNQWARASARKLREERVAKGLCTICDSQPEPGYAMCPRHLGLNVQKRRKFLDAGKCCRCGGSKEDSTGTCQKCKTKRGEYQRRRKQKLAESGLCISCGVNPPDARSKRCAPCRERFSGYRVATHQMRLADGLCAYCGKERLPEGALTTCPKCYLTRLASDLLGTRKAAADLLSLFERQGGICPYSGLKLTLGVDCEIDHKTPESRGGASDISNLQWVHKMVNQMKFHYPETDFLAMVGRIYRHCIAPR